MLKDFYELWPERFSNNTNGVTPRRFLALANPGLRELLDRTVGDGWLRDLSRLRGLEPFVDDTTFGQQWRDIKRANKARLATYVGSVTGVELNPDWMFDVQVKRIHEWPGLSILATEDHYVGSEATRRRAAERAGARTEVLDGLGHWWMLEDPARGAAALTRFWATLD